jgi:hypothetical protein
MGRSIVDLPNGGDMETSPEPTTPTLAVQLRTAEPRTVGCRHDYEYDAERYVK